MGNPLADGNSVFIVTEKLNFKKYLYKWDLVDASRVYQRLSQQFKSAKNNGQKNLRKNTDKFHVFGLKNFIKVYKSHRERHFATQKKCRKFFEPPGQYRRSRLQPQAKPGVHRQATNNYTAVSHQKLDQCGNDFHRHFQQLFKVLVKCRKMSKNVEKCGQLGVLTVSFWISYHRH